METTIFKTVKGATMEALFEECETFSVRYFQCLNLPDEKNWHPESLYRYEIKLRHPEDTDANVLFEEARYKQENLNQKKEA